MIFGNKIRSFDWILLFAVCGLLLLSLTALYSIGLGREGGGFLHRQLITLSIGAAAMIVLSLLNYRALKSFAWPIFACSLMLLIGVLFFGEDVRGTRGWFFIGTFGFQPVELAKIALILALARYVGSWTRQINRFHPLAVSACIAGLPTGLTLLQPDFGSATILTALWLAMIFLSGISRRTLATVCLSLMVLLLGAWLFVFQDYQKERIQSFLFPKSDESGAGYNVRQALIAIGGGQLLGVGIGAGSGSQLRFLPEAQTDFIFSVIAEELGFVGVSALLFLWILLFYRLIGILRKCTDDFAACLIVGIIGVFFAQFAINVGGNLGLIPITGLVLPFVSYGGSALLVSLSMIGLAQSIRIHSA